MKTSNARRRALLALSQRSKISDAEKGASAAERQGIHDLVLGVRRNSALIDAVLDAFLERPSRHLPPKVLAALRMGVYELLFRRGIPPAPVVSEVVDLLPTRRMKGLGNAVLRKIARSFQPVEPGVEVDSKRRIWVGEGCELGFDRDILPDPAEDLVGRLATLYTQTRWFVDQIRALSPEPEALLRALNAPLSMALRPAGAWLGQPEALAAALKGAGFPQARILGPVVEVGAGAQSAALEFVSGGRAVVQDYVPAQVAPLLDPQSGERILDFCAAPGGKSVHIAELLKGEGEVISADIDPQRLALLKDNAARVGVGDAILTHNLGPRGERLPKGSFDRVLVDAPCSNSGVLMKRVEARYRLKSKVINSLERLQAEILERATASLKPGGRLVYSTCSILPAENEALLGSFLSRHPEFSLVEKHLWLPSDSERDGGFAAVMAKASS